MKLIFAKLLGGFIHWLIHYCKTSLQDEIEGNLDATWGGSYDFENYIIGLVTSVILIGLIVWSFF